MFRILIVDDFKDILKLISTHLQAEDRQIEVSTNSEDALRRIENEEWDLIITDLVMPEVDGFRLVQAANDKDPRIPSIILTGYGTPDNLKKSLEVECFALLDKPCDWEYLKLMVEKAIASHVRSIRNSSRRVKRDEQRF